jgi:hypothetical protein
VLLRTIFLIRNFQQILADGSLGEGSGNKIGSKYFPFGLFYFEHAIDLDPF